VSQQLERKASGRASRRRLEMATSMVQGGLLPPRRPRGFGQTVEVRWSPPSELPEQGRRDA
jgi:hypothetical protein